MPDFTVENARLETRGRSVMCFDLTIPEVAIISCGLIVSRDGYPTFVSPLRSWDSRTGSFHVITRIDRALQVPAFEVALAKYEELRGAE